MAYKDKIKEKANWVRYYWAHPCIRITKLIRRKDKTSKVCAKDIWRLAKKQKMICPLTGRRLSNENISVDHIEHLTNGGSSHIENIRLTVKEANIARHTQSDEVFIKLCQDVVNHNRKA